MGEGGGGGVSPEIGAVLASLIVQQKMCGKKKNFPIIRSLIFKVRFLVKY